MGKIPMGKIPMGVVFAALCLAACSERTEQPRGTPASTATPAQHPQDTAAAPSAAAPAPPAAASDAGPMPAAGAIGYAGFGPAKFGASAEEVRMAWGKDMAGGPGEDPAGCYYLFPEPRGQDGYRIAFMIEGGRFVRIDVDTAAIEAPGGGRVGMSAEQIRERYGDVAEQPHKYVEGGRYLRRADAASQGVLVFATDAAGKVTEWRLGMPPQVDYVEGCS